MDGVTILNTYMTYADFWAAVMATGVIACVLLLISGIYLITDNEILTGVVLAVLSFFIGLGCYQIPQTKYYEAVIDSSVSWKQVTDKYDVVKIKGQIITLVEKEGE